jgi:hypothetical protein
MEYQLSHEDEEWDGEEGEGCNRSKNPSHNPYKTRYAAQEKIGSNHIDDEKGKGNRYTGKKQQDHTAKE